VSEISRDAGPDKKAGAAALPDRKPTAAALQAHRGGRVELFPIGSERRRIVSR